jgi:hypothetical protein
MRPSCSESSQLLLVRNPVIRSSKPHLSSSSSLPARYEPPTRMLFTGMCTDEELVQRILHCRTRTTLTELHDVADYAHDQEAYTDCLRDFCYRLAIITYLDYGTRTDCQMLASNYSMDFYIEALTELPLVWLRASVHELQAVLDKLLGHTTTPLATAFHLPKHSLAHTRRSP